MSPPTLMMKPPPAKATSLFDKAPPFDAEAEIGVLGSVMLLPDVMEDALPIVAAEDFHDDAHQLLYRHMLKLHAAGRRADVTLLLDSLNATGDVAKIGGSAYLGKVMAAVPNAAHAIYYAEIVRDKALLRRVIERATDILRRAYGQVESVADLVAEAESLLTTINRAEATDARLMIDVARESLIRIADAANKTIKPGVMTGVVSLDRTLGPIMAGEVAVFAARPGGGKTAIGMQIAEHNAERGRQVLFVSLEMKDLELVNRALCQRASLDSRTLRQGALDDDCMNRLRGAAATFDGTPLRVWAPPRRANTTQIRSIARRLQRRNGLDLLIVDYIGRVVPMPEHRGLRRNEQIGKVTEALKDIAKELDVPLIALCQLNRDAENQKPILSHLKESGDIEQDADIVVFLHHPDTRENQTRSEYETHDAQLIAAKHRHGAKGEIDVFWIPWQTKFTCEREFGT